VNGSLLVSWVHSDYKSNMAEKITARKEYRGLGYAPAISVPGLIQERPVAATRPPATNQLTKLAKSLSDFGETFKNTALTKAARQDEEAKQAATEALSSRAMGGWIKDSEGEALTPEAQDIRSIAFTGTDEDLRKAFTANLVPKEATPAFYAYLKRGMAKSIAQEFNTRLNSRLSEAADVYREDGSVNNSQYIREVVQEESYSIKNQFGDDWFLYAPDEVRKVEQQFINTAQAKLLENRKKAGDEEFKRNIISSLENSPSLEDLESDLSIAATEGRRNGLDVKRLTSAATVTAVSKYLSRGHVDAARTLVDRLQTMSLNRNGEEVPLLDAETEAQLEQMVEAGEHKQRLNRNQDQTRVAQVIAAEIQGWLLTHPNAGVAEQRAFVQQLLSKDVDLNRKDDEGNPITVTPTMFDTALFNKNTMLAEVLESKNRSAVRVELTNMVQKDIEDLIGKLDPAKVEEANEKLKENRNSLPTQTYIRLKNQITEAQTLSVIDKAPQFGLEAKQGLALVESEVVGVDASLGLSNLTPAQRKALPDKRSEFLAKFKKQAQDNLRQWLKENPNNEDENALRAATDEAITEARKSVIKEMSAPTVIKTMRDNFEEWERNRVGSIERDPLGPNFLRSKRTPEALERRSITNIENGQKLIRRLGLKKGETVDGKLKKINPAVAGILKARLADIAGEQRLIEKEARKHRSRATSTLTKGVWVPGYGGPYGGIGATPGNYRKFKDLDERAVYIDRLRAALVHTGVTPEEVIAKTLKEGVVLDPKKYGEIEALFNPYTTPMFSSVKQLLELNTQEETIKKMAASLGIEPAVLVKAQLQLLRSQGK